MIKRSKEELVELFLNYQKQDKYFTPVELKNILGYKNPSRIYKALQSHNITYTSLDKNKLHHSSLNQEVIIGNLLGDGFIYYSTKQSNYPVFSVEYKHKEYCEYIQKSNPFLNGQKIMYRKRFDERFENGDYEIYKCTSLSSSVLKDLHSSWYKTGTKKVPENIVLNPLTLLIWFMDDGYKASSCKGLYLATDGFTNDCNEILRCKLNELGFNTSFHIASSRKNVRLYINANSSKDFLNFIGPCPVNCYQYKWE